VDRREDGKKQMRKRLVTATFLMLMIGPAAVAQTGNSSAGKQEPWPAPTGHRQPRLDQVPADKNTSSTEAMKREDAELDRKLKSICRGC
jgi:hypothetical protein